MAKSPEMERALRAMFPERRRMDFDECVFCGDHVSDETFKDELSRKEYDISGMCQTCQDLTFVEGE